MCSSCLELPSKLRECTRGELDGLSKLDELVRVILEDAKVASAKGNHSISREAARCVHALARIKSLPPESSPAFDPFPSLQFLATHGNPRISSEARSVLHHWRNIEASCSSSSRCEAPPKREIQTLITRAESVMNSEESVGSCSDEEDEVTKVNAGNLD